MKVTISFEYEPEYEGLSGSCTFTRSNTESLEELAEFLTDATRGAGWSYVENVGFERDDGAVVFGRF